MFIREGFLWKDPFEEEVKNGTTGLMLLIKMANDSKLNELGVIQMKYGSYYYKSDFICTRKNGKPITPMSVKYMSDRIHAKSGFPFIVGKS